MLSKCFTLHHFAHMFPYSTITKSGNVCMEIAAYFKIPSDPLVWMLMIHLVSTPVKLRTLVWLHILVEKNVCVHYFCLEKNINTWMLTFMCSIQNLWFSPFSKKPASVICRRREYWSITHFDLIFFLFFSSPPLSSCFRPSSSSSSKKKASSEKTSSFYSSSSSSSHQPPPTSDLHRSSSSSSSSRRRRKHMSTDLSNLLERLSRDPGFIALLSGSQLNLLAEMDVEQLVSEMQEEEEAGNGIDSDQQQRYSKTYLEELQKAADQHVLEKNEIRDAVGLLKLYHQAAAAPPQKSSCKKSTCCASTSTEAPPMADASWSISCSASTCSTIPKPEASPRKRRRDKKWGRRRRGGG